MEDAERITNDEGADAVFGYNRALSCFETMVSETTQRSNPPRLPSAAPPRARVPPATVHRHRRAGEYEAHLRVLRRSLHLL